MRVIVGLLFLFAVFACALPGRADPLPTADEIKAKAAALEGPEPANFAETIVGAGTLGALRTSTFRLGDDVRHTSDRGTLHNEWGTYHGEQWREGGNGLVVAIGKDPGKAVPDALTSTVKRVASPIDAWLVSELNARSAGTRTYYDPADFRPLRVEEVGPTGTKTTSYTDYAPFGGRMLPRHWTVEAPAENLDMSYDRISYVTGRTTDADVREASTSRQVVEFPPGTAVVALPVRIVNNVPYVRVTIGSHAGDFALDTGASGIYIDTDYARSLDLPFLNATSEVTAQRYTGFETVVPDMTIGSLQLHHVDVGVVPMKALDVLSGVKPVGLLGFDFLAQLGVTIDYERGTVTVVPAAAFAPPVDPATYAFSVRVGDGVPMLTVNVAGFVADRVFFDTGWSGELGFFDYFARRYPHAFSTSDDLGPAQGYGVGGRFAGEFFRLHEVQLGPIHFRNFVALRIPPSASYDYDADGIIGNVLLSKFIMSLDYTDGMVYLTPTDDTKRAMHPLK
jgi:hypothetical protein